MAFLRPTLVELVDRIQTDFESRLDLTGTVLRRSMVRILSRVIAGASHMLHGHLDFLSRQLFADKSEAAFLRRQGAVFGVTPNEATFAVGTAKFTGSGVVPSGTVVLRSDGAEYTTDAEITVVALGTSVAVTASLAGEAGNCDVGTVLTLESPISGVDSEATVDTGGLSGGADQEDDEAYRLRVLERIQNPPHGGSDPDYKAWAKEVAGVTRAWVYPRALGAGTVVVRFTRDDDLVQIPDSGEVTAVQDYIDARKPVTATVTVLAPVAAPLNFTFASITPDTVAVRAAIAAELADLMLREGIPGETLLLSQIRTAIGIAEGLEDYELTSPAADVTHSTGQLPTMGTVTYV